MKEQIALVILLYLTILPSSSSSSPNIKSENQNNKNNIRNLIELKGGPDDVVWIVQLSDLHFSVHHPDRALDFKLLMGPTLAMIKPSLVLITGDLTDGKSKDMLTMKQDKEEWLEYTTVMEDVITRSGLKTNIFYDLRGNHDNFDVPLIGGSYDFFSNYSINGQLKRSGLVNSITLKTGKRKVLLVGFDSTMLSGLKGPTNLFGHPSDALLDKISQELSQGDSETTKISFGHFPLSFTATTSSGNTLKDTFLKHSLSAYLCGHLHTKFGKNLKRHHEPILNSHELFQLKSRTVFKKKAISCASEENKYEGFWEYEMGDWRKSRAMRILAIDRGFVSFIDLDLKLGHKKTIILPTFPLDSRVTPTGLFYKYKCESDHPSSFETMRALVFSVSPIISVIARIYDTSPGHKIKVLETPMIKLKYSLSRGDQYAAPWNFRAFEDPNPERFWFQIEVTDIRGRITLTELTPFSINGVHAKLSWSFIEFFVMGCQWEALYYPLLCLIYLFSFSILLIPRILKRNRYTYKNFKVKKTFTSGFTWIFTVLHNVPFVWLIMVIYLFYLILCPWLYGQVFTQGSERRYMTYRGWVTLDKNEKIEFVGFPDIMVIVLPHLLFVVLPCIVVIQGLAAEKEMYRDYVFSRSGKKDDDVKVKDKKSNQYWVRMRLIHYILVLVCLVICWKHFKNCGALMKAYEMNPIIHFPIYAFSVPLLLAYTLYKTRRV